MSDLQWIEEDRSTTNLVTADASSVVAVVKRLGEREWEWDVLRYSNAYGRETTKARAMQLAEAAWRERSGWVKG